MRYAIATLRRFETHCAAMSKPSGIILHLPSWRALRRGPSNADACLALLNKLTPTTYEKLAPDFVTLAKTLEPGVVSKIVLEKAVDDALYVDMYARILAQLDAEISIKVVADIPRSKRGAGMLAAMFSGGIATAADLETFVRSVSESSLETVGILCALFCAVGNAYDSSDHVTRLRDTLDDETVPFKDKCAIRELLETRARGWTARHRNEGPRILRTQ